MAVSSEFTWEEVQLVPYKNGRLCHVITASLTPCKQCNPPQLLLLPASPSRIPTSWHVDDTKNEVIRSSRLNLQ